jgi:hypothetical protein
MKENKDHSSIEGCTFYKIGTVLEKWYTLRENEHLCNEFFWSGRTNQPGDFPILPG